MLVLKRISIQPKLTNKFFKNETIDHAKKKLCELRRPWRLKRKMQ